MLKSRLHSPLLLVSGIAFASLACSSGGDNGTTMVMVPVAGNTSTGGGSDSGGSVNTNPTGGSSATAGTGTEQAGSQATAGSGTGGSAGGDTAAGGTGGSGGGTGGSGGGTGGTGGGASTFCGTEAGKVVLFDGSDATFKNWYQRNGGVNTSNPWTLNADGSMTVKNGSGDIVSKAPYMANGMMLTGFQNVCLHVEYQAPKHTYDANTDPQQRGNSGIYLKGSWEMQVLDTFDLGKTQNDYCGAVYKISAPLVSACKTGGEWNAYDIEFQGQVCTNPTTVATPAKFVKVNLNGTTVQNNVVIQDSTQPTQAGMNPVCEPRGILLQDHNTIVPVSFRNIWAIPRP